MSETPELDRLKARLAGARNFHVSWGPQAHELTPEERAAVINRALDEAATMQPLSGFPKCKRPSMDVRDFIAEHEAGLTATR